jgi:hypothetical protein
MKKITISLKIALIAMTMLFVGCKGDDGNIGPAGSTGEKGDKGDVGATGENGEGFGEAVKYGKITLTLTGKKPGNDNIDFTQTMDFRFTPSGADELYDFSYALPLEGVGTTEFGVRRFYGSVDDVYQENYVDMDIVVDVNGPTPIISTYNFEVNTGIVSSDFKYFKIRYDHYEGFVGNASYSEYSYSPTTGSLRYKFSFTVPGDSNDTGHDLSVNGLVDAIVLQDGN